VELDAIVIATFERPDRTSPNSRASASPAELLTRRRPPLRGWGGEPDVRRAGDLRQLLWLLRTYSAPY